MEILHKLGVASSHSVAEWACIVALATTLGLVLRKWFIHDDYYPVPKDWPYYIED